MTKSLQETWQGRVRGMSDKIARPRDFDNGAKGQRKIQRKLTEKKSLDQGRPRETKGDQGPRWKKLLFEFTLVSVNYLMRMLGQQTS